jgi:ABC-type sugar transport system ATPase subunit
VWLRERARAGAGAASALLEVQGVSKRFGGLLAVNEVDLLIPPASIIGLIGPNGAGKTTFFNVVTGLIQPDAGRIAFEGRSLVGLRPNAIVARGVARTFQSIRLFQQLSALDNVLVGRNCRLAASVAGAIFRPPFAPISLLGTSPAIFYASKRLPAKDLRELIAWLRANPNKASAGISIASWHLLTAFFQKETATQFTFVPIAAGRSRTCCVDTTTACRSLACRSLAKRHLSAMGW